MHYDKCIIYIVIVFGQFLGIILKIFYKIKFMTEFNVIYDEIILFIREKLNKL